MNEFDILTAYDLPKLHGREMSPENVALRDAAHADPGVWKGLKLGPGLAKRRRPTWNKYIAAGKPYEVAQRGDVLWLRWMGEAS
jgi:hypothetical protein